MSTATAAGGELVSASELRALYTRLGPEGARLDRALTVLLSLRLDAEHPQVSIAGVRTVLARHGWSSDAGAPDGVELWQHPKAGTVLLPDGVSRNSALVLGDLVATLAAHTGRGAVATIAELIDATLPHESHPEGLNVLPLPACLAPSDAARAARADLHLPHPGDPVVLSGGTVLFLQVLDPGQTATADNTQLWGAGMRGHGSCEGADWEHDLDALDPDELGLEEGDPQRLRAAWDLLARDATDPA